MKQTIAIILTVILAFSVISCGTKTTPSNPSDSAVPADSGAPVSPSDNGTPVSSGDSGDPVSPSETATAGYLTDELNHFDRDPFKLCYICHSIAAPFQMAIADDLEILGKALNFTLSISDSNFDYDKFLNAISVYAEQGYDGMFLSVDAPLIPRAFELASELEIAFVAESTPFEDEDGNCTWPSVAQDQYSNGAAGVNWLIDNYKNYWTDPVDTSKLGLLVLDFSVVSGIHEREPGAHDTFVKAFPEAADNYFVGDLITTVSGFSVAGGEEMTLAIMAAHPEIEYWFVEGLVDDWSLGATRAVEQLNKEDCVLIVSVQSDSFIADLESGNSGNIFVAACAIAPAEFAGYLAANLVTILENRATAESIWPEWVTQDSSYPCIRIKGTMITKDTYKDWLEETSIEVLAATIPVS